MSELTPDWSCPGFVHPFDLSLNIAFFTSFVQHEPAVMIYIIDKLGKAQLLLLMAVICHY
jgi:hypothetical protein